MDFKIRIKRTKEEHEEYIATSLIIKKLIKNPRIKISNYSKRINRYLIACIIMFIFPLFEEIFVRHSTINYVMFLCLFIIILNLLVIRYSTNKDINTFKDSEEYIECKTNKKVITFKYKEGVIDLLWVDMKYIVINNYTLCFVPNSLQGSFVSMPVEYRDEIEKILKKYHQEDLLIDNSDLYNK